MKPETVYQLYQQLASDQLSFLYSGFFSDDITEWVVEMSDQNLQDTESLNKMQRRISFLMVECLQNVVRHGNEHEQEVEAFSPNLFMTRHIGEAYYITSANLIRKESAKILGPQLDDINQLDQAELKELYRTALKDGSLSSKGGGGLGLIEMARKSGQKIDFDFSPWNEALSHFFFRLKLVPKGAVVPEDKEGPEGLAPAKNFLHIMDDHQLQMIFKGDLGKDFLVPILHVMENHMRAVADGNYRRVIKVLIELLQNISKHGEKINDSVPGIFILAEEKQADGQTRPAMYFGNYTTEAHADALSQKVAQLNKMDGDSLTAHYRSTLKDGQLTDSGGGAGLGLIEAARHSAFPLEATAIEEDKHTFIGLKVVI